MKTFFLTVIVALMAAIALVCSSAHAGQSEKQAYCTDLANIAGSVASYIHEGVTVAAITKDTDEALSISEMSNTTKEAIRAAVAFAIMMASQHNISAETIAKYQYYGCLMST